MTARATTTTEAADAAITVMMIVTVAGCRTNGVYELLARASGMRSFAHVSELRPTYLGTTGTPTPTCGSRTIGSRATREER
jgi:hypothetical protein